MMVSKIKRRRGLNGLAALAITKGNNTYTTGVKCARGHLAPRYVTNNQCIACSVINNRMARKQLTVEQKREIFERQYKAAPWRFTYDRARGRALREGIPFNITAQDVKNLWPKDFKCPVLGVTMQPNIGKLSGGPCSPSLDKLNPSLGYVKGNIAVISLKANQIKSYVTDSSDLRKVADWIDKMGLQFSL